MDDESSDYEYNVFDEKTGEIITTFLVFLLTFSFLWTLQFGVFHLVIAERELGYWFLPTFLFVESLYLIFAWAIYGTLINVVVNDGFEEDCDKSE